MFGLEVFIQYKFITRSWLSVSKQEVNLSDFPQFNKKTTLIRLWKKLNYVRVYCIVHTSYHTYTIFHEISDKVLIINAFPRIIVKLFIFSNYSITRAHNFIYQFANFLREFYILYRCYINFITYLLMYKTIL